MPSTWIIDGFNLLRQSRDLVVIEAQDLGKAKSILLDRLKHLAALSHEKIICVFDATGSTNPHRIEEFHGPVKFIYTRAFEIADETIISLSQEMKQAAIVVTSDREIIRAAQRAGSSTLGAPEFDRLLYRLTHGSRIEEEEEGLDPRRGTQKKGPAHRRPKKERKVRGKMEKWL